MSLFKRACRFLFTAWFCAVTAALTQAFSGQVGDAVAGEAAPWLLHFVPVLLHLALVGWAAVISWRDDRAAGRAILLLGGLGLLSVLPTYGLLLEGVARTGPVPLALGLLHLGASVAAARVWLPGVVRRRPDATPSYIAAVLLLFALIAIPAFIAAPVTAL